MVEMATFVAIRRLGAGFFVTYHLRLDPVAVLTFS